MVSLLTIPLTFSAALSTVAVIRSLEMRVPVGETRAALGSKQSIPAGGFKEAFLAPQNSPPITNVPDRQVRPKV